jgi:xylulokinase
MSLLGVDVGSSRIKAVVLSLSGEILAQSSAEYSPDAAEGGRVEMSPDTLWNAFAAAVRGAAAGTDASAIEGMALASHGETFLATDDEGRAVAPAIMNADNRALEESRELTERFGYEKTYSISGAPPHPMFALAKIAWMRRHAPEVMRKAERFLCVGDYLCARMGLPPVIDPSLAARTQLFDIRTRQWSPALCDLIGLKPAAFSSIQNAGTLVGHLSSEAAAELGLPKGVAVVAGGHDQPVGALGLGVTQEGMVGDSAGTYECLTVSSSQPHVEPAAQAARLNSYCHVVPGQYITLAFFPSGVMVRWFTEVLCGFSEKGAMGRFLEALEAPAAAKPSGLRVAPHLLGACNPRWNPNAKAAIINLTVGTGRAAIFRGILEGIAFELAENVRALETLGCAFDEIRVFGGGARSALGLKLRAAAAGKSFRISKTDDAACLGAAILAGMGCGVFAEANEGVRRMVRLGAEVPPDPELGRWFERNQGKYRQLCEALSSLDSVSNE